MANYMGALKTNWFRVTDEERLKTLISRLEGEDVHAKVENGSDGSINHFIGSYGDISFRVPPSLSRDVQDHIQRKIQLYDENGNAVSYDNIDSYDSLYDAGGECVYDADQEYDFDIFVKEIQKILPKDDYFIYVEVGHEKLRSINGSAVFVTKNEIEYISLAQWIIDMCKTHGLPPYQI